MTNAPRTVLVTGTSSGIGRAIAQLLAGEGFRVLAGTRRLADAPASPPSARGGSIEPVLLDITVAEQIAGVRALVEESCPQGLYAVVNNAGLGPPSATELTDLGELRAILEVNTIAPLAMIQACLPALRRGHGRIVNISSMNGTLVLPMVGAYSASKFALEALSDALRVELTPWSIPVSIVRPGQVCTPIFAKASEALTARGRLLPPDLKVGYEKFFARSAKFNDRGACSSTTPEAVARTVLKALEARRPRVCYLVGWDAWGLQALRSFMPTRLRDRLLARASGLLAGRAAVRRQGK